MRTKILVMLIAACGFMWQVGCRSYTATAASFDSLRIPPNIRDVARAGVVALGRVHKSGKVSGATGIAIGDKFITNRHVVPPGTKAMIINGIVHAIEIIAIGADFDPSSDWCVFQTIDTPPQITSSQIKIDFEREISNGDSVILVGFPMSPDQPRDEFRIDQPLTVFPGVVVRSESKHDSASIFEVALGTCRSYRGLSGGPVMFWDSDTQVTVIVGLAQGQSVHWGPGPMGSGLFHSAINVVRPPMSVMTNNGLEFSEEQIREIQAVSRKEAERDPMGVP